MDRRWLALALHVLPAALLAACAQPSTPPQPPSAPLAESPPAGGGEAPSGGPSDTGGGSGVSESCPPSRVFDPVAKGCRMFPGGGYGSAGCSLSPGPPNGESCVTSSHWVSASCDCVCDQGGTRYSPEARACR